LNKKYTFILSLFGLTFSIWAQPRINVLGTFTGPNGACPYAGVTLASDGNFYGTTEFGGAGFGAVFQYGTVFRLTPAGTLTSLASFSVTNGANPEGALTLGNDGNLYGTTEAGGSSGDGTIFQVTTNGGLTTLLSFANTNGANPYGSLALGPDGSFYGTTYAGGSSGDGTVFKVTTNGSLTTLVSFNAATGVNPYTGLTLGSDGNFYGTTLGGTNYMDGTIFQVTTNGTLKTLAWMTDSNGWLTAGVIQGKDGNLYGMTPWGGSNGYGSVYQVTTNGAMTTLLSFGNTNGAYPQGSLTLGRDGNFYGTTPNGGNLSLNAGKGYGTVFRVTTNGALTTLAYFNSTNGAQASAALAMGLDGSFYGTTFEGGSNGYGVVYQFIIPVPISLSITTAKSVSVLSWPASAMNYRLQVSTNPGADSWSTVSNDTPFIGAQTTNTSTNGIPYINVQVTNVPGGAFFRLQQNP
jgi:uncharacterized repeat protein (TIGR03803 family)